jgi:outer membrane receptor protein involved in Fe transport
MLYPSVHLSKSFNDKHQFQLSYSRRINRPQPYLLNKTPAYIDPYNIFKGSPSIEPEYTDAFELNYRFMYKIMTISTQTYYRLTTNSFSSLRILDITGIMTHQLINSNNQTAYGVELGLDFNLNKWWQINSGGNFYRYNIESLVNNNTTNNKANSWDARLISNFTVLKTATRIQAIGYFRGSGIDAQGNSTGFYTVNLALNQPLLKGKLNLGVSGQNIFNTIKYHYTVKSDKYNNDYLLQSEGPVILFTASISFNNFKNKQRGRSDDANFRGGGAF